VHEQQCSSESTSQHPMLEREQYLASLGCALALYNTGLICVSASSPLRHLLPQ